MVTYLLGRDLSNTVATRNCYECFHAWEFFVGLRAFAMSFWSFSLLH